MAHLVAGVILLALGLSGLLAWWDTFGFVMRGLVPCVLLIVGTVAVLSGGRAGALRAGRGGDGE